MVLKPPTGPTIGGAWYLITGDASLNLPVIGDQPPNFAFAHTWKPGDDYARSTAEKLFGAHADNLSLVAQTFYSKGITAQGNAIWQSSNPNTLNVQSKIIGGEGGVLKKLDVFRIASSPKLGVASGVGGMGAAGLVDTPGVFQVIITMPGGRMAKFTDMVVTSMSITPMAPYFENGDPIYTDVSIQFQSILPGFAHLASIG